MLMEVACLGLVIVFQFWYSRLISLHPGLGCSGKSAVYNILKRLKHCMNRVPKVSPLGARQNQHQKQLPGT